MVYLISYDIAEQHKKDENGVLALLKSMGAVRCLYSEWLYESTQAAIDILNDVSLTMSAGDRLLVVPLRGAAAYTALLNEKASVALLSRA